MKRLLLIVAAFLVLSGQALAAMPAYRAASGKAAGTAPITVTLPVGIVANDIVFLVGTTLAGGSITITANGSLGAWTPVSGSPVDVTGGEKLYVWWARHVSGTQGPTISPGSDHIMGFTFAISGAVTSGTPIEATETGTETTSDTSFSFATTVSTTDVDRLVCVVYSSGVDSNTGQGGTPANAALSSVTLRVEYETNLGDGGGAVLVTGGLAAAGSCGTWSDTMVSATPKAYINFALIPPSSTSSIKTVDGLAKASVKTVDGLAIGSVKTINGLQ